MLVAVRIAMLLSCVLAGCSTSEPCVGEGEYEFFALRAPSGPADGGVTQCPAGLEGSLEVLSSGTARFVLDGGFAGDCSISATDLRPRYACQVTFNCSAAGARFSAFSFVGPEQQSVIDGSDGPPPSTLAHQDLKWIADDCSASYSWSAVRRGAR